MGNPCWVTVEAAAPTLQMKKQQIYRAIREKVFPFRFVKIGKLIRIDARSIGLIEERETAPEIEVGQIAG